MNEPFTLSALARSSWRDFLRSRRALVVFLVLFEVVKDWLLGPAVALLLAGVLSRAGRIAVSNQDVLGFLLTPLGLLYAALFAAAAVAALLFEQAGVMVLADRADSGERPSFGQTARGALGKSLRVAGLGAVGSALLALAMAPFALLGVLAYRLLLSEHDVYFYWKVRPPVFWVAACVLGLLLLAALAVAAHLFVRWALALPVLLFENQSPRAALRASRERVRGAGLRVGAVLIGWLVGVLLLGIVAEAGFRLFAAAVLDKAGERPFALIALLLVAQGGLLAAWSFAAVVGLGLLTRRLYLFRGEALGLLRPPDRQATPGAAEPASTGARLLACACLVVLLLAPLALFAAFPRQPEGRPLVRITAHRGDARAAPENTLAAMRKAIESGADYAEMDVHLTRDGVVALLHDRDLKRVAGVSRRLDELTWDEVRRLDVGSWFDPAFAGERVPTLAEVIRLCRGKIRLNIELKVFGSDRRLARKVSDLVREHNIEDECLVTSLDYDALREAKRHNPRLRTGLTVAHALGDVSRLEVDALSIRADFLSDEVLRAAHRLGREVHVWTVNDSRRMTRLMERGVDNIITSDPALALRTRAEWAKLTGPERLVLGSRLLLGLDPPGANPE
jgi:glycerophosphoryl diester phosphodiesterase